MIIGVIAAGIVFGIIGGMGLGGGIVLVPVLTFIFSLSQHSAQGLCLAAFMPASAVALFLHFKNKMIDIKKVLLPAIFGAAAAYFGAKAAILTDGETLRYIFGGVILIIGVYKIIKIIKTHKENR